MDMDMDMNMNMTETNNTGSMPSMHRHMWMWFHTTLDDTVLIHSWYITKTSEMIGSCIGVFILSVLFESLKTLRLYIDGRTVRRSRNLSITLQNYKANMFTEVHVLQTFLFILQTLLGYMLMLIFMTFSIWLCLATTLGMAAGYYLFNDRTFVVTRNSVVDLKTCCD